MTLCAGFDLNLQKEGCRRRRQLLKFTGLGAACVKEVSKMSVGVVAQFEAAKMAIGAVALI